MVEIKDGLGRLVNCQGCGEPVLLSREDNYSNCVKCGHVYESPEFTNDSTPIKIFFAVLAFLYLLYSLFLFFIK